MSTDEVYRLMARAGELPYGEAKTALIESALQRAEAAADEVLAYRVRMELTGAYQHGGEPAKAFTTFSRCLAQHDRDPGRFEQNDRLLWHFKWIVNSLTLFPEIPLDRTYAALEDMERRFRLGGHSLQAVHHYRHVVARHVGDREAADEWYARWHAAPRDKLSDCEGCDPTGKARHLAERGRDEEAIALAAPVLNMELNCTEQPQNILATLLPSYLRTGRLEEAGHAHRRAYRLIRSNIRDMGYIADHVEFCARTGNQARGLEIVQRHLDWLDRAPSPHSQMEFAAAAALLLRRLGQDDLTLRRLPGEVTVAELHQELSAQALELAGRFDARNGTSHQGDRIRSVMEAEPMAEHLPLTPYARRPTTPVKPPEPALPEDPDALLEEAEEAWRRQEPSAAVAIWRRYDELVGEPSIAQQARRADGLGVERLLDGDPQGALAAWGRAAELHAQAGDLEREQSAVNRSGAMLCGLGRPEEGIERLATSLGRLDELVPGSRRAFAARVRLANGYLRTDRAGEALTVLADATAPTPEDAAEAALARGAAFARMGDHAEAEAAFRRACESARSAEAGRHLAEAAIMLAQFVLNHRGPPEDASADEVLTLLGEAITSAPPGRHGLRSAAHALRGTRLIQHGRDEEAVEDLVEAVAAFTAEDNHVQAAYARLDLAAAMHNVGRHFEAAEVAEEAGPMMAELGDAEAERRSRFILAQAQQEMGEEDAADTYTALAGEEDHPGIAAQLLERAADVLTGVDKDALAVERYEEAAQAFAKVGDPYGVVRTLRRSAMCLSWSGRPGEGLTRMAQTRAALDDLPRDNAAAVTWETAVTAYDEARILADADRVEEARQRANEAVNGFRSLGEDDAADTAIAFIQQLPT